MAEPLFPAAGVPAAQELTPPLLQAEVPAQEAVALLGTEPPTPRAPRPVRDMPASSLYVRLAAGRGEKPDVAQQKWQTFWAKSSPGDKAAMTGTLASLADELTPSRQGSARRLVTGGRMPTPIEAVSHTYLSDFTDSFQNALATTRKNFSDLGDYLVDGVFGEGGERLSKALEANQQLYDLRRLSLSPEASDADWLSNPNAFLSAFGSGLGSMASTVGMMPLMLIPGVGEVAMGAGVLSSYAQSFGQVFDDMRAAGVPVDQAGHWALGAAVPMAAAEYFLPMKGLERAIERPIVRSIFSQALGQMATHELEGEAGQQLFRSTMRTAFGSVGQNVRARLAQVPLASLKQAIPEGIEEGIQNAIGQLTGKAYDWMNETDKFPDGFDGKSVLMDAAMGGLLGGLLGLGAVAKAPTNYTVAGELEQAARQDTSGLRRLFDNTAFHYLDRSLGQPPALAGKVAALRGAYETNLRESDPTLTEDEVTAQVGAFGTQLDDMASTMLRARKYGVEDPASRWGLFRLYGLRRELTAQREALAARLAPPAADPNTTASPTPLAENTGTVELPGSPGVQPTAEVQFSDDPFLRTIQRSERAGLSRQAEYLDKAIALTSSGLESVGQSKLFDRAGFNDQWRALRGEYYPDEVALPDFQPGSERVRGSTRFGLNADGELAVVAPDGAWRLPTTAQRALWQQTQADLAALPAVAARQMEGSSLNDAETALSTDPDLAADYQTVKESAETTMDDYVSRYAAGEDVEATLDEAALKALLPFRPLLNRRLAEVDKQAADAAREQKKAASEALRASKQADADERKAQADALRAQREADRQRKAAEADAARAQKQAEAEARQQQQATGAAIKEWVAARLNPALPLSEGAVAVGAEPALEEARSAALTETLRAKMPLVLGKLRPLVQALEGALRFPTAAELSTLPLQDQLSIWELATPAPSPQKLTAEQKKADLARRGQALEAILSHHNLSLRDGKLSGRSLQAEREQTERLDAQQATLQSGLPVLGAVIRLARLEQRHPGEHSRELARMAGPLDQAGRRIDGVIDRMAAETAERTTYEEVAAAGDPDEPAATQSSQPDGGDSLAAGGLPDPLPGPGVEQSLASPPTSGGFDTPESALTEEVPESLAIAPEEVIPSPANQPEENNDLVTGYSQEPGTALPAGATGSSADTPTVSVDAENTGVPASTGGPIRTASGPGVVAGRRGAPGKPGGPRRQPVAATEETALAVTPQGQVLEETPVVVTTDDGKVAAIERTLDDELNYSIGQPVEEVTYGDEEVGADKKVRLYARRSPNGAKTILLDVLTEQRRKEDGDVYVLPTGTYRYDRLLRTWDAVQTDRPEGLVTETTLNRRGEARSQQLSVGFSDEDLDALAAPLAGQVYPELFTAARHKNTYISSQADEDASTKARQKGAGAAVGGEVLKAGMTAYQGGTELGTVLVVKHGQVAVEVAGDISYYEPAALTGFANRKGVVRGDLKKIAVDKLDADAAFAKRNAAASAAQGKAAASASTETNVAISANRKLADPGAKVYYVNPAGRVVEATVAGAEAGANKKAKAGTKTATYNPYTTTTGAGGKTIQKVALLVKDKDGIVLPTRVDNARVFTSRLDAQRHADYLSEAELQKTLAGDEWVELLEPDLYEQRSSSERPITRFEASAFAQRLKRAFPRIQVLIPLDEDTYAEQYRSSGGQSQTPPIGFVDNATGVVYLSPNRTRADTPLHEFGHVWTSWARKYQPARYEYGRRLVRTNLALLSQVRREYPHLSGEALEEEALARIIGQQGLNIPGSENKTWAARASEWVAGLWKAIGRALGRSGAEGWERLSSMTLDEFAGQVAADLQAGTPISETFSSSELAASDDLGVPLRAQVGRTQIETTQTVGPAPAGQAPNRVQAGELKAFLDGQDKEGWRRLAGYPSGSRVGSPEYVAAVNRLARLLEQRLAPFLAHLPEGTHGGQDEGLREGAHRILSGKEPGRLKTVAAALLRGTQPTGITEKSTYGLLTASGEKSLPARYLHWYNLNHTVSPATGLDERLDHAAVARDLQAAARVASGADAPTGLGAVTRAITTLAQRLWNPDTLGLVLGGPDSTINRLMEDGLKRGDYLAAPLRRRGEEHRRELRKAWANLSAAHGLSSQSAAAKLPVTAWLHAAGGPDAAGSSVRPAELTVGEAASLWATHKTQMASFGRSSLQHREQAGPTQQAGSHYFGARLERDGQDAFRLTFTPEQLAALGAHFEPGGQHAAPFALLMKTFQDATRTAAVGGMMQRMLGLTLDEVAEYFPTRAYAADTSSVAASLRGASGLLDEVSYLQKRKALPEEVRVADAIAVAENYLRQTEAFVSRQETIHGLGAWLQSAHAARGQDNTYTRRALAHAERLHQYLARTAPQAAQDPASRLVGELSANVTRATFAFKVATPLKQMTGFFVAMGQNIIADEHLRSALPLLGTLTARSYEGFARGRSLMGAPGDAETTWLEKIKANPYALDSPLWVRILGQDDAVTPGVNLKDFATAGRQATAAGQVWQGARNFLDEYALGALHRADRAVMIAFYAAAERQVQAERGEVASPEAQRRITDLAVRATYATNAMYNPVSQSELQRDPGPIAKILSLFAGQQIRVTNLMFQKFLRWAHSGYRDETLKGEATSALVGGIAASALITAAITVASATLKAGLSGGDDREDDTSLSSRLSWEFGRTLLGSFPGIPSAVATTLTTWIDSEPWSDTLGDQIAFDAANRALKGLGSLKRYYTEDLNEKAAHRAWLAGSYGVVDGVSRLAGLPNELLTATLRTRE